MTKCLRLAIVAFITTIASFTAKSQNVAINNTGATANASGILDVSSTTKGVLVPRMDKTQKNAIPTPANALLVYQTGPDSIGFHYYDAPNARWVFINANGFATDTTAWKITGNSNITSANFLGTTNDTALRFRVRNAPSGIVDSIRANTALGFRGLGNLTTGVNNTSFGAYSALNLTTGNNNIISGINAAFSTDTASNTTAIGSNSLYFNKHNNNFSIGHQAGTYMDLQPVLNPSVENTFVGTEAGYGFWAIGRSTALGYRALYNQNGGTVYGSTIGRNVAIGDSAMAWTYSSRNVAVGVEALSRARVSSQNVAIGDSAMGNALSTAGNVAVGYKALNSQVNQGFNTAVGYFSQRDSSKDTYFNTSIGAYSMEYNRIGIYNTGLGLSAMRNADSTSYNTAVGADAMYNHKKNGSNVAVGAFALRGDSSGFWNTAVGSETMDAPSANNRGNLNTALGFRAMRNHVAGDENTALGVGALEADSSGYFNTAVGRGSLFLHKRGNYNTAIGYLSGRSADTTYEATLLGTQAGYFNKVPYTTAVGTNASFHNNIVDDGNPRAGKENTAVGQLTLFSNALGIKNTAVGYHALTSNQLGYWGIGVTPSRNTAVGDSAANNTAGNDIVAVGSHALSKNLSGSQHVAVGSRALFNATGNYPNTAIGYSSMDSATTATANTAVGSYSLTALKVGINNTAVGNASMYESTAGNDNTAVGNDAGRLIRASGNTVLGASALRNDTTGSFNTSIGWQNSFQNDTASFVTSMGVQALYNNTVDSNVAVGFRAGYFVNNNPAFASKEQTFVGSATGMGSMVSSKNTALGYKALAQETSPGFFQDYSNGGRNTAIGANVLSRAAGISNVGIGADVMSSAGTSIFQNVAIGDSAMGNSDVVVGTNFDNVAVGYKSLTQVRNHGNITMGAYSGRKLTNTVWNTAIGYHALEVDTTGSENTVIGTSAFRNNFNGIRNVSLGINTGFWNTSSNNTFLGSYAGQGVNGRSTGGSNTAVGFVALTDIRSGTQNVAVGEGALASDSSGSLNVAVGAGSFESHLRGNDNVAMGFWAGRNDTASQRNVLIGRDAGYNNQSSNIVAIGYQALYNNTFGATSSEGVANTAVGNQSLSSSRKGNQSTALGFNALLSDTSAGLNTAVGAFANQGNTSGTSNTAMGSTALGNNTSGGFNTAIGQAALLSHRINSANTAVGSNALQNDTTGSNNTAVGVSALFNNGNGTNITALGRNADVLVNGLSNATAIGYRAAVGQSNSLVLGSINGVNGSLASTNIGMGTTTPDARLHIVRSGISGGTFHPTSSAIIEDNTTSYLQFSNPNASETGFLSGNATTNIRSGMIFRADSSIQFRSGGNITAMTIDNTNFVGIGNTTPADLLHVGTTTGARIRIGSFESIEDFGANVLAVNANWLPTTDNARSLGTAANRWTTVFAVNGAINTSDARDKENIENLNYGINDLMKLRPVSFTWKENPQWGKKIGFIAQEVQPVLKEVIQVGELKTKTEMQDDAGKSNLKETDKLGIYYSDIIPVAVKAIQEQQAQIEAQAKENADLKKKNEQLEADIKAIKAKLGIQ